MEDSLKTYDDCLGILNFNLNIPCRTSPIWCSPCGPIWFFSTKTWRYKLWWLIYKWIFNFSVFGEEKKTSYRSLIHKKIHKRKNDRKGWYTQAYCLDNCKKVKIEVTGPFLVLWLQFWLCYRFLVIYPKNYVFPSLWLNF